MSLFRQTLGYRFIATILLLSQSTLAFGQSLSVEARGEAALVSLNNIPYPSDIVTAELKSGLPLRFIAFLSVIDADKTLAQHRIVRVVRYDLWDEVFLIESLAEDDTTEITKIETQEDLEASLKSFTFREIVLPRKNPEKNYVFVAQVVFNPISEEQTKKIQRWISRGRARSKNVALASSQGAPDIANPSKRQLSSRGLLDSFIANSIDSDQLGADWKSKLYKINWTPADEQ